MNLKFWQRKSRRELELEYQVFQLNKSLESGHKAHNELRHEQELTKAVNHSLTINKASLEKHIAELESQPPPIAKIELHNSHNISLREWCRNENLVASAAGVLKNPDLRAMLDVLVYEHPGTKGLALSASIEQRAVWQAEAQGYQRCLNNLKALGEKPSAKKEVAETYAEENVKK